jgi:hypothetical protein
VSSFRVRQPIAKSPPEFTVEFYSIGGDGLWMVLENGRVVSWHWWKWQARLAARRLRGRVGGDG